MQSMVACSFKGLIRISKKDWHEPYHDCSRLEQLTFEYRLTRFLETRVVEQIYIPSGKKIGIHVTVDFWLLILTQSSSCNRQIINQVYFLPFISLFL